MAALTAAVGAVVGGAALGLVGGSLAARPSEGKRVWIVVLLVAAAVLTTVDRLAWEGLYPEAHDALRLAALWLFAAALAPAIRGCDSVVFASYLLVPLAGVVPFATLDDSRPAVVHRLASRPFTGLALRTLRRLTDVDGDGHSATLAGRDCAPWDDAIHPGAPEVPGNGVDDNCLLGDAASAAAAHQEATPASGPSPLSVVVVTLDSLRADGVGA